MLADIAGPEAFARRLERGDHAPLTEPARIEMVSPPNAHTRYAIQGCPKCAEFFCLDVKRVDVTFDDKDKRQEEETLMVDKLIVGRRVYEALRERYGDASEAPLGGADERAARGLFAQVDVAALDGVP